MWKLKGSPYAVQEAAAESVEHQPSGWAYYMEMGLGKTAVALNEFMSLFAACKVDKMIVVCPYSLTDNWANEIKRWSPHKLKVKVWPWKYTEDADVYILYYESLAVGNAKGADFLQWVCDAHHCYVVLDESIQIKNPQSKRTKALLKLRP